MFEKLIMMQICIMCFATILYMKPRLMYVPFDDYFSVVGTSKTFPVLNNKLM
jgi:hypothetical protein